MSIEDPFAARSSLGPGLPEFYRLAALESLGDGLATPLERAPMTLKILLENVLRQAGRES